MLLCAAVSLRAQSLDAFKQRLAEPVAGTAFFGRAQVTVAEHGARGGQQLRVRGFRVCIFSDNGPEARNGAFAAQKLFEETYPGVKVYMDYKIPYFVVSVGDCLSNEEAVILKGRVTGTFPKAFLKNEEFPISNLLD